MNTHTIRFHGKIRKLEYFRLKKVPHLELYYTEAIGVILALVLMSIVMLS